MCSEKLSKCSESSSDTKYVLCRSCDSIDKRRYFSIVSDIKSQWKHGSNMEYKAMEWIADKIYDRFKITYK